MARILLVDDEPELLAVIGDVLGSHGHDVVRCSSGREARARIGGTTRIDFAIVDWSLPDVSGRDLLLDLHNRQPEARAVVVTGYGENIVSANIVNDRVIAVLRKPFRMRELLALIGGSPEPPAETS